MPQLWNWLENEGDEDNKMPRRVWKAAEKLEWQKQKKRRKKKEKCKKKKSRKKIKIGKGNGSKESSREMGNLE